MHWTIIGGGLQGTTIAIKLRHHGLPLENLTIIDPYTSLCEQFNQFSQRIRMPFFKVPVCTPLSSKSISFKTICEIPSVYGRDLW